MTAQNNTLIQCGDVTIDLALGEARTTDDKLVRFSPVNLKVLELLLTSQGEVLSRAQIFDQVWANQIVSDDTLTRAISDIRVQFKQLTPNVKYIETLPKRGYHWIVPVQAITPTPIAVSSTAEDEQAVAQNIEHESASRLEHVEKSDLTLDHGGRWPPNLERLKAFALYILFAIALAGASIWLISKLSLSEHVIVAVLPAQSISKNEALLAEQFDEALYRQLIALESLQVLSRSAVATAPRNPFPYFFTEFGVKWIVEYRLSPETITISLINARSAIVLHSASVSTSEWEVQATAATRQLVEKILLPSLEQSKE